MILNTTDVPFKEYSHTLNNNGNMNKAQYIIIAIWTVLMSYTFYYSHSELGKLASPSSVFWQTLSLALFLYTFKNETEEDE